MPPGAFAPPPKVTSSVIELTRRETPLVTLEEREPFFATVRAGFSAPRKQLRNTLAQGLRIEASAAEAALASAGIEPSLRPAMLSVEDWLRLSRAVAVTSCEDTGMTLELIAPAKLNLTLEILGKRDDGYHEVISLMQTIDLVRRVTLGRGATALDAEARRRARRGPAGGVRQPRLPRRRSPCSATAGRQRLGARIRLQKHIPAGFGLGGGSSDAAAVLRGLNSSGACDLHARGPQRSRGARSAPT